MPNTFMDKNFGNIVRQPLAARIKLEKGEHQVDVTLRSSSLWKYDCILEAISVVGSSSEEPPKVMYPIGGGIEVLENQYEHYSDEDEY